MATTAIFRLADYSNLWRSMKPRTLMNSWMQISAPVLMNPFVKPLYGQGCILRPEAIRSGVLIGERNVGILETSDVRHIIRTQNIGSGISQRLLPGLNRNELLELLGRFNERVVQSFSESGIEGLPKKNILPLAGVPLIAHTIEAALMAEHVGRVIVSTDGEDIAAAAREAGADVPFMRPQLLATDTATSESLRCMRSNGWRKTAIPPISLFICSQQNPSVHRV